MSVQVKLPAQSKPSVQSKPTVQPTSSARSKASVQSSTYSSDRIATFDSLRDYLNNIIKRAEIDGSLDVTFDETIDSMFLSEDDFERINETFPSLKMEYVNGKIKIVDVQGAGHQKVISAVSGQLFIFCQSVSPSIFSGGGGTTPTYVQDVDGFHVRQPQRADPDEILELTEYCNSFVRLIFEVEIHNRNFNELDRRMKFLMDGWPECYIGIACKFFSREVDGGVFQGVLFVYYKRDGFVKIERICDIGTIALSLARRSMLATVEGCTATLEIPESRCTVVARDIITESIETSNPDFYRITVDSDLLYRDSCLHDRVIGRPSLVIDFIPVLDNLHRVKSKSFARVGQIRRGLIV